MARRSSTPSSRTRASSPTAARCSLVRRGWSGGAPSGREGLARARGVLVGSRHTAESLWGAMGDPELARRTRLGPPGVDVEQFAPREPAAARARLEALAERVRAAPAGTAGSSFARDPAAAADALAAVDPPGGPGGGLGRQPIR